jgi:hypothetical protein
MMYKVPMPSRSNGVKLHTIGDHQIGIEYTVGEPHVGKLAYDSSCGILSKNVEFRRPHKYYADIVAAAVRQVDGRDALPPGTGIERSKSEMKPRGSANINDEDPDADNSDEIVTKLMSYLNDKLTPEQLNAVATILGSADDDAPDLDAGEPRRQASDSDRAIDRRRMARLAADAARHRPMSDADEAEFLRMFPHANRLLQR